MINVMYLFVFKLQIYYYRYNKNAEYKTLKRNSTHIINNRWFFTFTTDRYNYINILVTKTIQTM